MDARFREEKYMRRESLQEERERMQQDIKRDWERLDSLSRLVESRNGSVNLSTFDMSQDMISGGCFTENAGDYSPSAGKVRYFDPVSTYTVV